MTGQALNLHQLLRQVAVAVVVVGHQKMLEEAAVLAAVLVGEMQHYD
jgi:hypothetical protein